MEIKTIINSIDVNNCVDKDFIVMLNEELTKLQKNDYKVVLSYYQIELQNDKRENRQFLILKKEEGQQNGIATS